MPVLGNGDIFDAESALDMLKVTGCAGLMVARGAEGNPFIFGEIRAAIDGRPYTPPTDEARMQAAIDHAERFIAQKPAALFPELRKHMSWYSKGMRGAMELRRRVNTAKTPAEMLGLLYNFKESLKDA